MTTNCDFDLNEITENVKKVLYYSQGWFENAVQGVPAILDLWQRNKSYFIEHMNGQLIYQLPETVSFELDDRAKRSNLERFAGRVSDYYDNVPLADFLYNLKLEDFYNNITSQEYPIYYATKTVPKKFKIVKAFKFLEDNEDKLKELQSEASRIIQENVISGHLCFSVHPLDYLSISENAHNWRSCHALDGDYRSGNLNYMVDPTTVICYLRADKEAVLPHFPSDVLWNSKKWRNLLFFSNDRTLVMAGRPYPFAADSGIELIRTKLLPALNFGTWSTWRNTCINHYDDSLSGRRFVFSNMIPVGNTLKPFKEVVFDGPNTYHYNDLLRSSIYSPKWSYRQLSHSWLENSDTTGCSDEHTHIEVGEACPCPICGQDVVSFTEEMSCPHCANNCCDDDYRECEICGSMTHMDNIYNLDFSDLCICQSCWDRETVRCQECGIHDMPDVIKYREGDPRRLCPSCYKRATNSHKHIELVFN